MRCQAATVGDDRHGHPSSDAFLHAGQRADAVIVNGGLGPTVDDLSQEIAAKAAGVELALNEEWLTTMESFFARRSRVMSSNNRKQAMLPVTAEILDNPIGTACGFAMDIGKALFFFTPGVPRELRRMLEEQIIPRLLWRRAARRPRSSLKLDFIPTGSAKSHVDQLCLPGLKTWCPTAASTWASAPIIRRSRPSSTVRGANEAEIEEKLARCRKRSPPAPRQISHAEDDDTLGGL